MKKPPPGQDLSRTEVASSLEKDKSAPVMGEIDFGLDDDPDLRTRPGQKTVLRREPQRRGGMLKLIVVVLLLGIAGAWLGGALEAFGFPPPAALSGLLGDE